MNHRILRLRARLPRVLALAAIGLMCAGGVAEAAGPAQAPPPEFACDQGQFCAWSGEFYGGEQQRLDLRSANPQECIPLTEPFDGHSFANRMDRMVTVYEGRDCSTEGDFTTYPGGGTFVPQAPFVARAVQIWD